MTMDREATLIEIVSTVLQRPLERGQALARADEPKWDSLRHVEIVFALEAAFGVSFSVEEMSEAHDLDALRRKLESADAP